MERLTDNHHVQLSSGSMQVNSDSPVLIHFSHSGKIRLKKSTNLCQKWKSENSLAGLFEPLDKLQEVEMRGVGESYRPDAVALSQHTCGRRKSVSLNSIPLALLNIGNPSGSTTSIPSLALHTKTAHHLSAMPRHNVNLYASSLKSSKSIEMLSGQDFKVMASNLQGDNMKDENALELPTVPERKSAFLKNCVVTDEYLIRQGKRLSGLPLDSVTVGEEKHFKSLFKRVGDVLKKVGSSASLTSSCDDTRKVKGGLNSPHLATGSIQNLQSGSSQQCVVLRHRKTSKSWDDLRLGTHSCSDINVF